MTDITQKLIKSDGLTEIKDGETFDVLLLTRSRENVRLNAGGIGVLVEPLRQGDTPWQVYFCDMRIIVGKDGWLEDNNSSYEEPDELYSNQTDLFRDEPTGLASKLTHVFVSGSAHTPVDN